MKFSDKAKAVISAIAPTLGTALGGPLGGLAGTMITNALGGDKDGETQIEARLEAASPETLLGLKSAEQGFLVKMEELGITREKLEYDDRANARSRETALGGDQTTRILAYMVVGSFIAMAFSVLFKLAVAESTLMGTIIGYMSAKAEQVIAYHFGSSRSSKEKTTAMAEAMRK